MLCYQKDLINYNNVKKSRLQELANIAIKENKTNADDLKAAVVAVNDSQDDMTSEDLLGAIEDGYYALTDNLPNLINDIQKAIKLHAKINPKDMNQIKALQNELKIYKGIQALIDDSAFGTFL